MPPVRQGQSNDRSALSVVGLFAGIGGLELGLERAGHRTTLLCEIDEAAKAVLAKRFPGVPLVEDVRSLQRLPQGTTLVAAGFPCQDLSQAGKTNGINGRNSGLVDQVFRLLREGDGVPHVLLENVPFMLQLNRGHAMQYVTGKLEQLGYAWAYRIVDANAFGLPQRRRRVFLLASKLVKPWELLYQDRTDLGPPTDHTGRACGFYWTEGTRGLGWAVDAIPTLKGGSTIGIPSSPAIWLPDGRIVTPDIRDAERLQGFPAGWTLPAEECVKAGYRWKLVGNAVSVKASEWLGETLSRVPVPLDLPAAAFPEDRSWPDAAWGSRETGRFAVPAPSWPKRGRSRHLSNFLKYPPKRLSYKATTGFLRRLTASSLKYPPEFLEALQAHADGARPRDG